MAPAASVRRHPRHDDYYHYNDDDLDHFHLPSPFAFDPVPAHVDAASYFDPAARPALPSRGRGAVRGVGVGGPVGGTSGHHGSGHGHHSWLDFDRPSSSRGSSTPRRQKKQKVGAGMTGMTGEEFDALPPAVRRKYFSTLERLRFAQHAQLALSDAAGDRPRQRLRKGSLADRRGLDLPFLEPRRASLRSSGRGRSRVRSSSVSSSDASWFMTLPEKIRQRQFTQEEQDRLSGRLHDPERARYILDATDEAIYKAARGAHRQPQPRPQHQSQQHHPLPLTPPSPASSVPDEPATPSSGCPSCHRPYTRPAMADTVLDGFRWMDEEDDLDLQLDDYHANLDGVPGLDGSRRPSFRRRISISSLPFSGGSKRSPSLQSRPPKSARPDVGHLRQRSRALSLMPSRHGPKASVSSIDPAATHYRDPEARLKLRAYLASPQKFDEAIEFGFPSIDGAADEKENRAPRLSADIIGRKSQSTEKSRSFFWKDVEMSSLFDDDSSAQDPESPLTPMFPDPAARHRRAPSVPPKDGAGPASSDHAHLGFHKPMLVKQPEPYTHGATSSREMTLRMTLTRPDLRADDTALYSWQVGKSPLRKEPLILEEPETKTEMMHGPFGGVDGWGIDEKEDGVVKRFWNKVKSSQRKPAI